MCGDDEEVLFVGLHLGPLADVEHVLERERMQAVFFAEGLEQLDVAESVHVDPAALPVTEIRIGQIGGVLDRALVDGLSVVCDEFDYRLLRIAFHRQGKERGRTGAGSGVA